MRALLLCPTAALEARDRGESDIDVVFKHFIKEIEITPGLQNFYQTLSYAGRKVDLIEFVAPLLDHKHEMIIDEEGLLYDPQAFIVGRDIQSWRLTVAGRGLIVGPADENGEVTPATMSVAEANEMFDFTTVNVIQAQARIRFA
jgi:hypothetical protein